MTPTDRYGTDLPGDLPDDARVINCHWCNRVLVLDPGEHVKPGEDVKCPASSEGPTCGPRGTRRHARVGNWHPGGSDWSDEAAPGQENAIRSMEDAGE